MSVQTDDVTVKFGAVEYNIALYRVSGGFAACWECTQCFRQDRLPLDVESEDEAICEARKMIERHHSDRHAE